MSDKQISGKFGVNIHEISRGEISIKGIELTFEFSGPEEAYVNLQKMAMELMARLQPLEKRTEPV